MIEKTPSQLLDEAIQAVPPEKKQILLQVADGLMLAAKMDTLCGRSKENTALHLSLEALMDVGIKQKSVD